MEYTYTKTKIILTENGIEQRLKVRLHIKQDENGNEILLKEEIV